MLIAEEHGQPVGYLASRDRYLKRDELGAIFQLCVVPDRQRGLIGATLLKSAFDRAAYGCRLFCCWCAQDLAANHFWEAMGFVPIAFRTGSATRGKGKTPRVHLFWQKRIRPGDVETKWWYPSGTDGGALRADRLVLPIPAGTHWRDAKPIVLPGVEACPRLPAVRKRRVAQIISPIAALPVGDVRRHGLRFATPAPAVALPAVTSPIERPQREPKAKLDPRLAIAARELRDRWLERPDDSGIAPALPKYEVTRAVERAAFVEIAPPMRQLAA